MMPIAKSKLTAQRSSEEVHSALFPAGHSLPNAQDTKESIRKYIRKKHARR